MFSIGFFFLNTIFSEVEKNISIVKEVFVLNRKGSESVHSLDNITTSKLNLCGKEIMNEKEKNILTNNFFLPKCNIANENNLNILQSKKPLENFINSTSNTPNLEFQTLFKKTKLKQLNSAVNDKNCNFDKTNNINNYNKNNNFNSINDNDNFNTHNLLKNKVPEEEKSANKSREEINSTVEQYLKVRKSETKVLFGFRDILNIVCNSYCKRKIPPRFHEKFNFYEKASNSVSHYFDFIFMIKKFEEISILKNCLLSEEQEKMVEIMCKPILSSKEFVSRIKTIRNTKDSVDLYKGAKEFIEKVENNEDKVDRNIIRIMEQNVKKSYI